MKKRLLSIVLILSFIVTSSVFPAFAEADSGISADVVLSSEADLNWFRSTVASGNTYEDAIVIMTRDITMTESWTSAPRGEFKGTFDGCGHVINNLTITIDEINTSLTCYGIFRSNSGTIKNLTINGSISVNNTVDTIINVGFISGQNSGGVIDNCHVYGDITSTGNMPTYIGGITGSNHGYGKVINCSNSASISQTVSAAYKYKDYIGGIAGFNNSVSSIINCVNYGKISGTSSYTGDYGGVYIGGIAGCNYLGWNSPPSSSGAGRIINCANCAQIVMSGSYYKSLSGGIAGTNCSRYYDNTYVGGGKYYSAIILNSFYDSTLASQGTPKVGSYDYTDTSVGVASVNFTNSYVVNQLNTYRDSYTDTSVFLRKWEQGTDSPLIHQCSLSYTEIDPDCVNYGTYNYQSTCEGCGIDITYIHKIPLGHTIVIDEAVLATCETSGLTQGAHCSVCNAVILAQEYVAPLGHTVVTDNAVAPTCTETGLTEGSHCSTCSKVFKAQYELPALGHTVVTDSAIAPTCTETGLTEGSHCSVCSEVFVAQQVVDAKGHTIVTDKRIEPTCISEGLTQGYHCSVCREVLLAQTTIAALGHNHIATVTPKTCTTAGFTTHKCSRCEDEYIDTYVDASHEWNVGIVSQAATCTEAGCCHHACLMCDATYDEILPALGHDYVATTIAPTKTEFGYTEYKCSRCDDVYIANYVLPLGYDITVHANCKEITISSDEFPSDTKVAVGFYDEDGKLLKCALTNWKQKESFIVSVMDMENAKTSKIFYLSDEYSPLSYQLPSTLELKYAHEYTASIEKAPTCIETGIMKYTCDICGDYYTVDIPLVDHIPVIDDAVQATCVHTGLTEGSHCSVCNKILIAQTQTPLVDHTVVTDSAVEANCYHTGLTEGSHCSACGKVFVQQTVLPICHDYDDATCYLPETCKICGATRGSSLGHDYHEGTCTRCGYTPVTSISMATSSLSLHAKEVYGLSATVLPTNASEKTVVWSSSNKSVATVDQNGVVTALSAGTTKITASIAGYSSSCTVTVKRVLAVVNTLTEYNSQTEGSFSCSTNISNLESLSSQLLFNCEIDSDEAGKFDEYTNDDGMTLTMVEPNADAIDEEIAEPRIDEIRLLYSDMYSNDEFEDMLYSSSKSYYAGSTCYIIDYSSNSKNTGIRKMKCLYVGSHCTVWKCDTDTSGSSYVVNDSTSVQINYTIARNIANNFDSSYSSLTNSFGNWYDADGDGKLAIFCYDIDSDFNKNSVSTFVGGVFRYCDLSDEYNRINNIYDSSFLDVGTNMDCIHLDTFPLMANSYADPLGSYESCYSTIIHECQHLINFSYRVLNGSSGYYSTNMECYLNEAFSMAAEHMICGSDSLKSRINYFNSSTMYSPGSSLTYWPNNNGTLSQYANSYLFGQYIRTRYAQQTHTNGNTIFKAVLQQRQNNKGGDTLAIIASILNTNSTQLYIDFWNAIYLKESSGVNGFYGESWANSIQPFIYKSISGNSSGIYNGGCKYYETTSNYNNTKNISNVNVTLH